MEIGISVILLYRIRLLKYLMGGTYHFDYDINLQH